jgi:hypothetical protein
VAPRAAHSAATCPHVPPRAVVLVSHVATDRLGDDAGTPDHDATGARIAHSLMPAAPPRGPVSGVKPLAGSAVWDEIKVRTASSAAKLRR